MSQSIVVASVDRKALPMAQRAQFSIDATIASAVLYELRAQSSSGLVVLDTCERFEVYSAVGDARVSAALASLQAKYRITCAEGTAALNHLFRVASGLESQLPGEPHVLGQVRAALNSAESAGTARGPISDAFAYAIRCGKRVRQQTALGRSASSYVERVVCWLSADAAGLVDRSVAIVGTGALARELAVAISEAGVRRLTVIGRHAGRAVEVAQTVGAAALTLDQLPMNSEPFDVVVAAASSAHPLVTSAAFASFKCRVFVDLGSAPNVDPAIDQMPNVRVRRLEHFGGVSVGAFAVREAECVVAREVERYLATRALRPRARELANRRASDV